jgi:hypothetical protein
MSIKKKYKLKIVYEESFILFAIITSVKEYTLAWHLNKLLRIYLKKAEEIKYEMNSGEYFYISNFIYQTEYLTYRLLKNKGFGVSENLIYFLVPEMKKYDFFLHIHGEIGLVDKDCVLEQLKKSEYLIYIDIVDSERLKSRLNFITLH